MSKQRGIVLLCWMYWKLCISAKRCCNGEIAILFEVFWNYFLESSRCSIHKSCCCCENVTLICIVFIPPYSPTMSDFFIFFYFLIFFQETTLFQFPSFVHITRRGGSIIMKRSVVWVPRLLVTSSNMLFGAVFKYLHNSLFIIVLWKSKLWWLPHWNIYPSHAVSAVLLWD